MALKALPTQIDRIRLQDLVPLLIDMEGKDCPDKEKAWASVRQATEADMRRVGGLYSVRTVRYAGPIAEETTDVNAMDEWRLQVFLCLTGVGNIVGPDDKPLFKFKRGGNYDELDMTLEEFEAAYGGLHPFVTRALRYAVWEANPIWDLRATGPETEEGDEEDEGEG